MSGRMDELMGNGNVAEEPGAFIQKIRNCVRFLSLFVCGVCNVCCVGA